MRLFFGLRERLRDRTQLSPIRYALAATVVLVAA